MRKASVPMKVSEGKNRLYYTNIFDHLKEADTLLEVTASPSDTRRVFLVSDIKGVMIAVFKFMEFDAADAEGIKLARLEFFLPESLGAENKNIAKALYKEELEETDASGAKKSVIIEFLLEYGGEDLLKLLKTNKLTGEDIINIAKQSASAMRFVHEKGKLHSDLKPQNITYKDGLAKLIDFGVSMDFGKKSRLQHVTMLQTGKVKGFTYCYAPPEIYHQEIAKKEEDKRKKLGVKDLTDGLLSKKVEISPEKLDVYLWGMTFYHLVSEKDMETLFEEWPIYRETNEAYMKFKQGLDELVVKGVEPKKSRQFIDILSSCLTYGLSDRPSFTKICQNLEDLTSTDYIQPYPNEAKKPQPITSAAAQSNKAGKKSKDDKTVTGSALDAVISVLKNPDYKPLLNSRDKVFEYKGRKLSYKDMITAAVVMKYNKSFLTLKVENCILEREGLELISIAIKRYQKIKEVNFKHCRLGTKETIYVAGSIYNNEVLTSLDISHNLIEENGAHFIADALENNKTITNLDISYNKISRKGGKYIAQALKVNNSLLTLDLMSNKICEEGARSLSEALQVNGTLKKLNINDNNVGNEGVELITAAFRKNKAITTLSMRSNNIKEDGAENIAYMLKDNSTLTELDVSDNSFNDEGGIFIAAALKENKRLTKLVMKNVNLKDKACEELGELIKTPTQLATLLIQKNKIGKDGAKAIGEGLKVNKALTTLNLNCNKLGEEGIISIAEALENNTTLETLGIKRNEANSYEKLRDCITPFKKNKGLKKILLFNDNIYKLYQKATKGKAPSGKENPIVINILGAIEYALKFDNSKEDKENTSGIVVGLNSNAEYLLGTLLAIYMKNSISSLRVNIKKQDSRNLKEEDWEIFCTEIKLNKLIKKVEIWYDSEAPPFVFKHLMKELKNSGPNITSLEMLHYYEYNDEFYKLILDTLNSNPHITRLIINTKCLSEKLLNFIINTIKMNTSLTSLQFNASRVVKSKAISIFKEYAASTTLTDIYVGVNTLSKCETTYLFEALVTNATIKNVKVFANKLSGYALEDISKLLAKNKAITEVELNSYYDCENTMKVVQDKMQNIRHGIKVSYH